MRRSKILQRIREGGVALVTSPSFTYSWRLTEMIARLGFDGVWIDMEHRDFGYQEAAVLILAARAGNADAVVRIRKDSYADYFRPLEDGAAGLMIPHIKTKEEAEFAVYHTRYAPLGRRGWDGVGADTIYGLEDNGPEIANRETFLLLQIEDYEALEALDEIAHVPGVDGFFVGPADLAQSFGIPGEFKHEKVLAAQEQVARVCRQAGKWWGAPGLDPEHLRWLREHGAQFIVYGCDYSILQEGFARVRDEFFAALD